MYGLLFFNKPATAEMDTGGIVGGVRWVEETGP